MSGSTVVLGVGNRMRGDDAVGCLLVDELAGMDGAEVFDCETTPENYLAPMVKLGPRRVLVVDSCDFGGQPGEHRFFRRDELDGLAYRLMSTHTLPLHLFIELLAQETGAEVLLLGIQPQQVVFGAGLSEPVQRALAEAAELVRDWAVSAS